MSYDLVIVGGTPSGIAAAIRATREGLSVVIVESRRLGGLLAGGLATMDVQYEGSRAPIYDELCSRILEDYAAAYGMNSPQYGQVIPRPEWPMTFEPHVAERVLLTMIRECDVEIVHAQPVGVDRSGRKLNSVRVVARGQETLIEGSSFVDATYEGDLFALCGEPYAVGREAREDFNEPHAGRLFTRRVNTEDGLGAWPHAALTGELALRPFKSVTMELFAGSTGEGDHRVQAYNYRLCLSREPGNRSIIERPDGYDPSVFRAIHDGRGIGPANMPNGKRFWWRNLVGPNWRYAEADEVEREAIRREYRDHALGFLYFLQNDQTVEAAVRDEAREWGLALDEYVENDSMPYELYIREARRLRGRTVFTEHDATLARGLARTPIHDDSIAFTDWFMDSHQVDELHQTGSAGDGEVLLTELSRPAQVPYSILLPPGLDNLLVTVGMSATHVGWGALRLEPVFMHVGEVAGFATALAKAEGVRVGDLDVHHLQTVLANSGVALAFFNDVDIASREISVPSIQLASTLGFFASFDARPAAPLERAVAIEWIRAIGFVGCHSFNPTAAARQVHAAEEVESEFVTAATLRELSSAAESLGSLPRGYTSRLTFAQSGDEAVSRGAAVVALVSALRTQALESAQRAE